VAGAVGSTTLASHFGASLEDHGPNVVLYRAGPQTARRAGSLRGHDHSRQSSSRPKSFHRPRVKVARAPRPRRNRLGEAGRATHRRDATLTPAQRTAQLRFVIVRLHHDTTMRPLSSDHRRNAARS
jgi:hypothetical protein